MTKAEAQRRHSSRRGWERYGIYVGRAVRSQVADAIRIGAATHVESQSLRVHVYDVTMADGLRVRVVWDRRRREIVTFLPRVTGPGC